MCKLNCKSTISHKTCIICYIKLVKSNIGKINNLMCPMCRTDVEIDKYVLNKIKFNRYFNYYNRLKESLISNGLYVRKNIIYTSNNEVLNTMDEQIKIEYSWYKERHNMMMSERDNSDLVYLATQIELAYESLENDHTDDILADIEEHTIIMHTEQLRELAREVLLTKIFVLICILSLLALMILFNLNI